MAEKKITREEVEDWFMERGWARWPYPGSYLFFYDPNNLSRPPMYVKVSDDDTVEPEDFDYIKAIFEQP